MLDHLAQRILPLYEENFWDEAGRTGVNRTYFENGVRYHRRMARSWFRRSQDSWWDRYASVRDPLLEWCDQYRLNAEWVIEMALKALLLWTRNFEHFEKFDKLMSPERIARYAATLSPDLRARFLAEQRRNEERVSKAFVQWPLMHWLPMNTGIHKPVPRTFTYPEWRGHDVDLYCRKMIEMFKQHLGIYRDEIEKKVTCMQPVPVEGKPEWFEALALKVCRGLSAEVIGDGKHIKGYRKHYTAVSKDICDAAKRIGLPLRRGRTPKKYAKLEAV